jgi:TolA-binding protein
MTSDSRDSFTQRVAANYKALSLLGVVLTLGVGLGIRLVQLDTIEARAADTAPLRTQLEDHNATLLHQSVQIAELQRQVVELQRRIIELRSQIYALLDQTSTAVDYKRRERELNSKEK